MEDAMLRFVNSRNGLQTNDRFAWNDVAQVGAECPWDVERHGVVCASRDGVGALVTGPGPGVLFVLQQGLNATWSGNFSDGDSVLHALGSNLPIAINFDTPVTGAGAQIQPQGVAGPFLGVLEVFFGQGLVRHA